MKKFSGIIFDIDGTLTSTNELIFAAFNHITKKYFNKTMSNSEIISLFGPTEDKIIEEWFPNDHETVKKEYYNFYKQNHFLADIYPDLKEILEMLKSKNILLGIFTGKGKRAAEITLKEFDIFDYFDFIITGDDVVNHKPSAEGIMKFIARFKLNKENVLMIGDAPADIAASRQAGIEIASVVWDSYAKDEVIKLNEENIFHTTHELKLFLENNI